MASAPPVAMYLGWGVGGGQRLISATKSLVGYDLPLATGASSREYLVRSKLPGWSRARLASGVAGQPEWRGDGQQDTPCTSSRWDPLGLALSLHQTALMR